MLRGLPELHGAVAGVIVLLVVRFAPRGLTGVLSAWKSRTRIAAELPDA